MTWYKKAFMTSIKKLRVYDYKIHHQPEKEKHIILTQKRQIYDIYDSNYADVELEFQDKGLTS